MTNEEITQYYDYLMRLATSKCNLQTDAEDLVGDTMLAALAYMPVSYTHLEHLCFHRFAQRVNRRVGHLGGIDENLIPVNRQRSGVTHGGEQNPTGLRLDVYKRQLAAYFGLAEDPQKAVVQLVSLIEQAGGKLQTCLLYTSNFLRLAHNKEMMPVPAPNSTARPPFPPRIKAESKRASVP